MAYVLRVRCNILKLQYVRHNENILAKFMSNSKKFVNKGQIADMICRSPTIRADIVDSIWDAIKKPKFGKLRVYIECGRYSGVARRIAIWSSWFMDAWQYAIQWRNGRTKMVNWWLRIASTLWVWKRKTTHEQKATNQVSWSVFKLPLKNLRNTCNLVLYTWNMYTHHFNLFYWLLQVKIVRKQQKIRKKINRNEAKLTYDQIQMAFNSINKHRKNDKNNRHWEYKRSTICSQQQRK